MAATVKSTPGIVYSRNIMPPLYSRCAGLDVHQRSVSACIRIQSGSRVDTYTSVFATFTHDLEGMRDWLQQYQVRQVAMESTGVYWIPVWNILERASPRSS